MKLKICGLAEPGNARAVCSLGVDYVGLNFVQGSPRALGEQKFAVRRACGGTTTVGVFVDAAPETVAAMAKILALDVAQLHGDESPSTCAAVRKTTGLPVIKAFGIFDGFDFSSLTPYEGCCDAFVFDSAGRKRGGSGKRFNWGLLSAYKGSTPFWLAGGIGPENISAALAAAERFGAAALDVSSGVEISPGLKSLESVRALVQQVRGA